MRSRLVALVLSASLFASYADPALADIITLYNTGVLSANNANGTNGSVITVGGTVDPHYTVLLPGGLSYQDTRVALDQGAYFRPAPASAEYINPFGTAVVDDPVGNYSYRTTFDLTGLDATTATISGTIFVDNSIVDIRVNGVSTGIAGGSYSNGTELDFMIAAGFGGFQSGLNTLDFILNNENVGPNPEALYVTSLAGTAAALAVPEPGSIALLGLATAGGIWWTRRRRAKLAG